LHRRYGDGCAAFINGDEAAEDVESVDAAIRAVRMRRADAAAD